MSSCKGVAGIERIEDQNNSRQDHGLWRTDINTTLSKHSLSDLTLFPHPCGRYWVWATIVDDSQDAVRFCMFMAGWLLVVLRRDEADATAIASC